MYTRRRFIALAGACLGAALMGGCHRSSNDPVGPDDVDGDPLPTGGGSTAATTQMIAAVDFYFDTVCQVSANLPQEQVDGALDLCGFYEGLFSRTIEGSDISRINVAAGAAVQVDAETCEIIGKALAYCEASGGLFDISIGAVTALWDFKEGIVPDEAAIAAALPHVGWRGVKVDAAARTVQLDDPQARLDLGGIAKGYIADKLIAYLRDCGATSACVNLGGNVMTLGRKLDGSLWRVGVQDSSDPKGILAGQEQSIMATVECGGESVVTSGLYERVFEKDGRRYWHILDPRTGYPVETDVVSATIVSAESIDGDGYTKPLFMWEQERIEAFFAAHPQLQGLVVRGDGSKWMSPGAGFVLL